MMTRRSFFRAIAGAALAMRVGLKDVSAVAALVKEPQPFAYNGWRRYAPVENSHLPGDYAAVLQQYGEVIDVTGPILERVAQDRRQNDARAP